VLALAITFIPTKAKVTPSHSFLPVLAIYP